jgi:hypothetical protein
MGLSIQLFRADFFRAFAHPIRIRILEMLGTGGRSVQELQHAPGLEQPICEISPGSSSRNVVTDRIATSIEWVSVQENLEMSKQPQTGTPEENPRNPQAPRRLDVPDEPLREELECVDHSDSDEEEPDGYGHGV